MLTCSILGLTAVSDGSSFGHDLVRCRYDLRSEIEVIPHGIPDFAPCDQEALKARFGVTGRRMLLTFGLLGPNKGIETVIRALPAVISAFPDLVYFVVGATHPSVLRQHGEAYRTSLERLAEQWGVREHVVFRDQYVTTAELCTYLQATDVFVSPYLNEAQVTSGAPTAFPRASPDARPNFNAVSTARWGSPSSPRRSRSRDPESFAPPR